MGREPIFKKIKKISEAEPHELIEIYARAAAGYVVKRYLVKFRRDGNTLNIDFYNKNGDTIWEGWYGVKRYRVDIRGLENGIESSKFRANGLIYYLHKDEAYNDAINLVKNKKQKLNKAIVDLQYALHSVE